MLRGSRAAHVGLQNIAQTFPKLSTPSMASQPHHGSSLTYSQTLNLIARKMQRPSLSHISLQAVVIVPEMQLVVSGTGVRSRYLKWVKHSQELLHLYGFYIGP